MKKALLLSILFICTISYSQTKEFLILDASTEKPIDLAQVLYPDLEIGSVSNKDGKIRIPLKQSKIIVSHINYQEEEYSYNDFSKKDTLYLVPNTNQLKEIVLYNVIIFIEVNRL